ncbi:adenosylcobinamide-phosphate synthase CbiB [Salinibaculum rarum]|uniref:adenosylcobinamide-phosphate synthase CbiB n=1 Tax=Salinibaculum rarum TaxID=3058903 RepID=UPI00265DBA3D|nr:adenosylcobinamide-phosphate synthase CbiB [Salinibaculum sp. KK48]
MGLSALVLGGSLALDVAVGEPPRRLHPVAWFGRLVGRVDRPWGRPGIVGSVAAAVLPVAVGLVVGSVVLAAGQVDPLAGALVGAVALFVSTSLRRLLDRVRDVVTATGEDIELAREQLRALAGRDATHLSAGEIRSAAVESLAENLADGLVAPLLYYAVFAAGAAATGAGPVLAIAAGCGGAAWVKGVNTLDSMLGYHTKPTGKGPARLDDAVMWLPARVSAVLLAVVLARPGALVAARRWQGRLASPNSGWPMGTLAAGLAVRLEKPGHYVLNAEQELPDTAVTTVAVRRVAVTGLLAYALAGVVAWY